MRLGLHKRSAMYRFLPSALLAAAALPAIGYSAGPLAHVAAETPFAATLDSIDSDGNVTFRVGDKLRVVPTRELAHWGRYRDSEIGPQFLLADGSIIRADLLKLDDESLIVGDATGLGRGLWDQSTLPRGSLRAILWQPPADAAQRDALVDELVAGDEITGRLVLVSGETIAGSLAAAPLDGPFLPKAARPGQTPFAWQSAGQAEPLAVPSSKVRAIQFATVPPTLRSARPTLWIGCRDGSLVQASSVSAANDKLAIKLVAGGALVTTQANRSEAGATFWSDVTWLHASGGSAAWLSDLKTLGYKHIPFLTTDWPHAADRSASGGKLRTRGAVYPKGLGMHPTSRLAYDVAGYHRFEAELAIDESSGRGGSAIYKVLIYGGPAAEWATAYASPILRGGDAPLPISIDLKGATRLALIVEFADRGDELDHANWLQARLIK